MSAYTVSVGTAGGRYRFCALGSSSAAVHAATLDRFGGLCSVVVIPFRPARPEAA